MAGEEEKDPTVEEPRDEAGAEEAPEPEAAESAPEPAPEPERDPDADLPPKERRRMQRSRRPAPARPQLSPEEREAERKAERARKARLRRTRRARERQAREARGDATGTPAAVRESNSPKVRDGIVVSSKNDKTLKVRIEIARRHRVYEKIVRHTRTLHVHDEQNEASDGDVVRVVETRPISKTKRWRLESILERAR